MLTVEKFLQLVVPRLLILVPLLCYPCGLHAQDRQLVWRDGVLYSEMADGGFSVLGSVTGYIAQEMPDGTTGYIKTKQIPADFHPVPQDNDTPAVRERRREIESLAKTLAEVQALRAARLGFVAGQPDSILTNDGLIFLIYDPNRAKKMLDLSESQFNQVQALAEKYKKEIETIRPRATVSEEQQNREKPLFANLVTQLRMSLINELSDNVLVPHQIRPANLQSPSYAGVIRILGLTGIGDAATLTEEQKKQLCERSAQIGTRLQAQIDQARRDVWELLKRELGDEQLEKVREFYPGTVERQIDDSSVEQRLQLLTFSPEAMSPPQTTGPSPKTEK